MEATATIHRRPCTAKRQRTRFIPVPGTPDGVRSMLDDTSRPLVLVSRHGLGDNVFASSCFEPLRRRFGRLWFASGVNAYNSIFGGSPLVEVLYCGSVNGADLGLHSPEAFCRQFDRLGIDLGVAEALVYQFGLFEPHLPYSDERAFVKGRRNHVELFGTGPMAAEVPLYHVAPDPISADYVAAVLDRWLPDRELIAVARYGHTDPEKNFGHDSRNTLQTAELIDRRFPDRFKYLSFDYIPGDHAADGRADNVRSVYGLLPCDAGAMRQILGYARLLITVPTGPMLVGATVPGLKLLTLWRGMPPYHFLDPQFGPRHPVHALVADSQQVSTDFMGGWPEAAQTAVLNRWRITVAPIEPETVATRAIRMLEEN